MSFIALRGLLTERSTREIVIPERGDSCTLMEVLDLLVGRYLHELSLVRQLNNI